MRVGSLQLAIALAVSLLLITSLCDASGKRCWWTYDPNVDDAVCNNDHSMAYSVRWWSLLRDVPFPVLGFEVDQYDPTKNQGNGGARDDLVNELEAIRRGADPWNLEGPLDQLQIAFTGNGNGYEPVPASDGTNWVLFWEDNLNFPPVLSKNRSTLSGLRLRAGLR